MSTWKMVQVGTVVAALIIGLMAAGCATQLQPRVVMTGDGPAAVLTTEQGTWSDFARNHWGKGGSIAAVGTYLAVAGNNGWFPFKTGRDHEKQYTGGAVNVQGSNNTVNYNYNGTQSDQCNDKSAQN